MKFSKVDRYNQYKFETKDVFILFGMGAFSSAALKYIDRCDFKGTLVQDLNKALYYLKMANNVNPNRSQISSVSLKAGSQSYNTLSEVTKDSLGTYLENFEILRSDVVKDRKDKGNLYYKVIEFILMGQFSAAHHTLELTMTANGVKIHE